MANHQKLVTTIELALSQVDRDELLSRLSEAGVPAGAIRNLDEVYESEQIRSQGMLINVNHSSLRSIESPGPAIRIDSSTGLTLLRQEHDAPPLLGEDTTEILRWANLTTALPGERSDPSPTGCQKCLGSP